MSAIHAFLKKKPTLPFLKKPAPAPKPEQPKPAGTLLFRFGDSKNTAIEIASNPRFEEKHEMFGPPCEILPHLYLGSVYNAVKQEVLDNHNITAIINVAEECPNAKLETFSGRYLMLVVEDMVNEPQYHIFEQAFDMIAECEASGTRCMVHCMRGRSRSATIVIGYLMARWAGRHVLRFHYHRLTFTYSGRACL
eukprot:TRINITY_DN3175_c0_g1_i1.p1 TRINITY_DN3175_c0_g1~~TRINITY_DN3175_c0_g1_i1.p1  ORF type:complete len:194 (+),score=18.41 TRINITY_DN3175_c0_g1_i1:125-706(+)